MIVVKEINSKKDKLKFCKFPIKLYKGNKYFVPQLISDEMNVFNPKTNGAFDYCEAKMFLAYKDGKIVGRIGAILNKAYNEKINGKQIRFTRFDFIDDFEVSQALFNEVNKWTKELQMNEIIGPMGFTDLDKQGMLVEGFEEISMYITIYNYPYYLKHMEKLGMEKAADWVEYKIFIPNQLDERIDRLANRVMERNGYSLVTIKNMKEARPWFYKAIGVLNEAYSKLFGVVTLSPKQMDEYVDLLTTLGNPDYITAVINKEGELIGYGYVAPSISKSMQKNKGRVFPFGIFRLLKEIKTTKVIDFYSIGVLPEYQNTGVNAIIMNNTLKGLVKNKIEYCETGPELESNQQIQSQWKNAEHVNHKRRRCYKVSVK